MLRWRPFRLHVGGSIPTGLPSVVDEWGDPVLHADVELPDPVAALLAAWRRPQVWTGAERADALAHLEQNGYRLNWVDRSGRKRAVAG